MARATNWLVTHTSGVSVRSAIVAGIVVFITLAAAGAGLAVVLYETLLSGVHRASSERMDTIANVLATDGLEALSPDLLETNQQILAVQIITPGGRVARRSLSAPTTPLVSIEEIGDGVHVGVPLHSSLYGDVYYSVATFDAPGGGRYSVLVAEGNQEIASTVVSVSIVLIAAAPVVVAASASVTFVLVRRSMRSVDEIRSRVAEISMSDLAERVPVHPGRDEIAALAVTMNDMLERLEVGHDAQRRFVGDASHELRSPITAMISALEVADAHPHLMTVESVTATVLPEARRMQELTEDLLLLAHADEHALNLRNVEVDLDHLAAEEIDRFRTRSSLRVDTDLVPTKVTGDRAALSRVLRNLLDNADRYARFSLGVAVCQRDGMAVLTVSDDGPGIAPADRTRVVDRFVRLDPDRSRRSGGAGLGLAIVSEIVSAHGGSLSLTDGLGQRGLCVSVQLPLAGSRDATM
jgi:signal transduction histidine kinase